LDTLRQQVDSIHVSDGVSSLKSQLQQIASTAGDVVSSAKSDFPNETSAIHSSISMLQTDVGAIASSPTPGQLVTVATGVKSAVGAVNGFATAAKSKCQ
jgi:phage-related protein